MRVGLDIGSTTIKCVVLDEHDALLYSTYERHYSHILEKAQELLRRIDAEQMHGQKALLSISGSAGMGLADSCGVPFVQEVFSTRVAVKRFVPQTDCVIELGGEDAKILFLTNGTEVRMNGSCAGGTGAFIDQMAAFIGTDAAGLDRLARNCATIYPIASRCVGFRQNRHSSPAQRGLRARGHCRLHHAGGGQPDHRRPGARQGHQGQGRFSRRPAVFFALVAGAFHGHAQGHDRGCFSG